MVGPGQNQHVSARDRTPQRRIPHLQTVYQFVDLCDVLQFAVREDSEVHLKSDFNEVPPERTWWCGCSSLAGAFRNARGNRHHTEKIIPTGGGLVVAVPMLQQRWLP